MLSLFTMNYPSTQGGLQYHALKLILILLTSIPMVVVAADADPSLLGYWPAEGNAQDTSGNGHDGTLHGGVTFASNGVCGKAFSFDGVDDWVDFGTSTDFNFGSNDFTISLWVQFNNSVGNYDNGAQILLEKFANGGGYTYSDYPSGSHAISGWTMYKWSGAGGFEMYTVPGGTISGPMTGLTAHSWHQVVVTRMAGLVSYYFDGELVQQQTLDSFADSDKPLLLGRRSDDRLFHANALFDEISIYSRALTASEVMESFTDPCQQDASPPCDLSYPGCAELVNAGISDPDLLATLGSLVDELEECTTRHCVRDVKRERKTELRDMLRTCKDQKKDLNDLFRQVEAEKRGPL